MHPRSTRCQAARAAAWTNTRSPAPIMRCERTFAAAVREARDRRNVNRRGVPPDGSRRAAPAGLARSSRGVHRRPWRSEALGHVQAEPPACVLVVRSCSGDACSRSRSCGRWRLDRERARRQVFRPKDSASGVTGVGVLGSGVSVPVGDGEAPVPPVICAASSLACATTPAPRSPPPGSGPGHRPAGLVGRLEVRPAASARSVAIWLLEGSAGSPPRRRLRHLSGEPSRERLTEVRPDPRSVAVHQPTV